MEIKPTLEHKSWLILNVLIAAIAIFFRFWHLSWAPGVNGDETWYGNVAQEYLQTGALTLFTPNGNLLNPLWMTPHFILSALFAPDFLLLRLPAVLFGLLAAWAGYWVCSKLFGKTSAYATALLILCLPLNIGYSRLSWDPSMSLFVDLLFLYACARCHPVGMPVALAAILIVHPTNLFLAPAAFIIWLGALLMDRQHWRRRVKKSLSLPVVFALFFLTIPAFKSHQGNVDFHLERLFSIHEYAVFLRSVTEFVWGPTIYLYIVGTIQATWLHLVDDWLCPLSCTTFLVCLAYLVWHKNRATVIYLLASLATWIFCFVTFSDSIFRPHYERYGVFTLAPLFLAVAASIKGLTEVYPASRRYLRWLPPAIGAIFLITFYCNYFTPLMQNGGDSHRAFRTNQPEPKKMAYDFLAQLPHAHDASFTVAAEDYWLLQPLLYLSNHAPSWQWTQLDATAVPNLTAKEIFEQGGVLVTFVDSPIDQSVSQLFRDENVAYEEKFILDMAGRKLIHILWH